MRRVWLTTLLLTGCDGLSAWDTSGEGGAVDTTEGDDVGDGDGSPADGADDAVEDTPEAPRSAAAPVLDSVEPPWGSDRGGSTVTLRGSGFDAYTTVEIDGKSAVIDLVTDDRIEITVPANAGAGQVDVAVRNDAGADFAADGFMYWPDGTGLAGGILTLERERTLGGYWVGDTSPIAWATLQFFNPADTRYWQQHTPTFGQCVRNWVGPSLQQYGPGAETVTLQAGNKRIALSPSSYDAEMYVSQDVDASAVPVGTAFDLEPMQGYEWPEFGISDAVESVEQFTVTRPAMDGRLMTSVGRTFTFEWNITGSDYVVIQLIQVSTNAAGDAIPVQVVSCAVPDDGAHTVPSDVWDGWKRKADDYLQVRVGRVVERATPLPFNNANLLSVAAAWNFGALAMN